METTPPAGPLARICPADPILRMLWGQWKTHVIHVLGTQGDCRFGVLRRTIRGISPKVLTQRLRELEGDDLIWREQTETIPPQVTYGLTDRGRRIHDALRAFDAVAEDWAARGA
jgi:DNA-binding HxlR family transcriptional regulator